MCKFTEAIRKVNPAFQTLSPDFIISDQDTAFNAGTGANASIDFGKGLRMTHASKIITIAFLIVAQSCEYVAAAHLVGLGFREEVMSSLTMLC